MQNTKIFDMSFASVYPHYITKVEKKGHTKEQVDIIILWLTGYSQTELKKQISDEVSFRVFFDEAPEMNKKVSEIK